MTPENRRTGPPAPISASAAAPDRFSPAPPSERPKGGVLSAMRAIAGIVLVASASIGLAWTLHNHVMNSARFGITAIEVTGNERRSAAAIIAESGITTGTNIFAADLDGARARILGDAWVVEASLVRRLPGTVLVRVSEHTAAAVVTLGDMFLASADGEPFKKMDPDDPVDLPLVTGLGPDRLAEDHDGTVRTIRRAIELAAEFERAELAKRAPLQEVHVASDGTFTLVVGHAALELVLGGPPFGASWIRRRASWRNSTAGVPRRTSSCSTTTRDRTEWSSACGEIRRTFGPPVNGVRLPKEMSTATSQGEIVVGLDIGTTKVCAVVAEVDGSDGITILGVGIVPCRGLRKGIVANIDWTVRSIRDAIESAQTMAGVEIRTIYAGIGGSHVRSSASDGVAAIAGGEVTRGDVERVLEGARAIPVDADRQILHVLPREYMVDSQDGIRDPIGMAGRAPRRQGQPRHGRDELRAERHPLRRALRPHRGRRGAPAARERRGRSQRRRERDRRRGRRHRRRHDGPPALRRRRHRSHERHSRRRQQHHERHRRGPPDSDGRGRPTEAPLGLRARPNGRRRRRDRSARRRRVTRPARPRAASSATSSSRASKRSSPSSASASRTRGCSSSSAPASSSPAARCSCRACREFAEEILGHAGAHRDAHGHQRDHAARARARVRDGRRPREVRGARALGRIDDAARGRAPVGRRRGRARRPRRTWPSARRSGFWEWIKAAF